MARTTEQILEQMLRHVPPAYRPLRPWFAALAAMLAEVEAKGAELANVSTIEGASEIWLRLLAKGYGIHPRTGEGDAALRDRLRNPERQLTRPAILAMANALLTGLTEEEAQMLEHWEYQPVLDHDFVLNHDLVSAPNHNAFTLLIPRFWDEPFGDSHLNDDESGILNDSMVLGGNVEHPVYQVIAAEVQRIRAAGVRWSVLAVEMPFETVPA